MTYVGLTSVGSLSHIMPIAPPSNSRGLGLSKYASSSGKSYKPGYTSGYTGKPPATTSHSYTSSNTYRSATSGIYSSGRLKGLASSERKPLDSLEVGYLKREPIYSTRTLSNSLPDYSRKPPIPRDYSSVSTAFSSSSRFLHQDSDTRRRRNSVSSVYTPYSSQKSLSNISNISSNLDKLTLNEDTSARRLSENKSYRWESGYRSLTPTRFPSTSHGNSAHLPSLSGHSAISPSRRHSLMHEREVDTDYVSERLRALSTERDSDYDTHPVGSYFREKKDVRKASVGNNIDVKKSSSGSSNTDDISVNSTSNLGSLARKSSSNLIISDALSNKVSSTSGRTTAEGLVGLKNLGNTCYMNSILQCLSNTKPLLEYCIKENYDVNSSSSQKGAIVRAFSSLLQSVWKDGPSSMGVSPNNFKSVFQKFAPRFAGYSQQDAQEFLRYLLQGLHDDINRVKYRPKASTSEDNDYMSDSQKAATAWKKYLTYDDSKIVDLFVGQLKSTLRCCVCGYSSVTFDPFWDLSVPIPKGSTEVNLKECLNLFTREEILDGDERPMCAKCKSRQRCTKTFSVYKLPKILVIHLKRFAMQKYRAKLTTVVNFPTGTFDMGSFCADGKFLHNAKYSLYAVCNHTGSTHSGHYTAYCKQPYSEEWHDFNDSRVSSVAVHNLVSSMAYVLFYELHGSQYSD